MSNETYNGWTNYESWLVGLWLDNDQGTHEAARELAAGCASDFAAGDAIKAFVEEWAEISETPTTGLFADLITAALARVDWRELGSHFREE